MERPIAPDPRSGRVRQTSTRPRDIGMGVGIGEIIGGVIASFDPFLPHHDLIIGRDLISIGIATIIIFYLIFLLRRK